MRRKFFFRSCIASLLPPPFRDPIPKSHNNVASEPLPSYYRHHTHQINPKDNHNFVEISTCFRSSLSCKHPLRDALLHFPPERVPQSSSPIPRRQVQPLTTDSFGEVPKDSIQAIVPHPIPSQTEQRPTYHQGTIVFCPSSLQPSKNTLRISPLRRYVGG